MITFTDKTENKRVAESYCRGCFGCREACGRKKGHK